MNLPIIKSKIISQFNVISYFILFISLLYCYLYINLEICNSKYSLESTQFEGIINKIVYKDEYIDVYINDLLIKVYYKLDFKLQEGMRIKVNGKFKKPESIQNDNLFDYVKYLKSKNINYIVNAKSIKIIDQNLSLFYKLKKFIVNKIENMPNKEYLFAFILGDVSYLDEDLKKKYQYIGVSHLFAVSGMHISFLTIFLHKLLSKLNFSKFVNFIILFFFLMVYVFLTNFSLSIMRSAILYILCIINKELKIKISTKYLLIILFSIFIYINPYHIYNVGFLFSYVISYLLITNSSFINKHKSYISQLLFTSIISFFASIPILINNYFNINLLTPLYNLIFIPMVSYFIFPLSLLTVFFPFLSDFLSCFIMIMEYITIFFSNIEILNFSFSHISINLILFYYIVIIYVINKINLKDYKYLTFLFILMYLHYNINYFDKYHKIHFLNIGQGDSILLTLSNSNCNILIDTGYLVSENILIPYLKSHGVKKLNYLILSHGDFDHMGEAINLVENFKVEKVIFNCGEFNELEQDLIKVLDKKKIPYYSCIKELNINNNKLYFLNSGDYGNENDNSSVIYTELNNHKFLFMGDAGVEVEEYLIEKYNLQDIDVLKVGHHGSKTSSGKEFIDEINPKYSIVSVGKNNRYGHPNKEVLNNLENSKTYRTDQDGSIIFKIKKNKLNVETCAP